jgi:hypothetical protein
MERAWGIISKDKLPTVPKDATAQQELDFLAKYEELAHTYKSHIYHR